MNVRFGAQVRYIDYYRPKTRPVLGFGPTLKFA